MTKKEIYRELKKFAKEKGHKVEKNGNYVTIYGDLGTKKESEWIWSDIIPEDIKEYLELVRWEATKKCLLFVRVKIL